ncbi:hypothetical protein BH11BAC6_BH11BAC6_12580 [soil metagenome]
MEDTARIFTSSTRIDEFVTNNAIGVEYEGVVNLTGIAAIIALDKLSFGLIHLALITYLIKTASIRLMKANRGRVSIGLNLITWLCVFPS